ncbi:MAG: hypothetical protein PUB99_09275, partial [Oscillospiraceae bacterium]|nr:hypothetical protein [Oscillospiraceae bacterium]
MCKKLSVFAMLFCLLATAFSAQAFMAGDPDAMYEYELDGENAVIRRYVGWERNCEIPQTVQGHTVVGIGDFAFENKRCLRSVSMPDTVEFIGYDAFA